MTYCAVTSLKRPLREAAVADETAQWEGESETVAPSQPCSIA